MTQAAVETVDICICTYRREHLADTLQTVFAQNLPPELSVRVIVADNDKEPSAKALVEGLAGEAPFPVTYVHAPERNISIARNACLDHADGDWLAFIDDDETAPQDWIATLWQTARDEGLDVVFGPVIANYPDDTPTWIRQGDYHSSYVPVHRGRVATGQSGNVLMRWRASLIRHERFLLEKGRTGGEDVEFFFRLSHAGHRLGTSDAARLHETPATSRLTYSWIRRRRFAAGQFHGAHARPVDSGTSARLMLLASSGTKTVICLVAAVLLVWNGEAHRRWVVRSCFHAGVFAAVLGIGQAELY